MSSSAMMVVYSHLHLININFPNVSASIRADTHVSAMIGADTRVARIGVDIRAYRRRSARSWFSVHAPMGAQCECCFRHTTDIGQMHRRRQHMTARGLQLSSLVRFVNCAAMYEGNILPTG